MPVDPDETLNRVSSLEEEEDEDDGFATPFDWRSNATLWGSDVEDLFLLDAAGSPETILEEGAAKGCFFSCFNSDDDDDDDLSNKIVFPHPHNNNNIPNKCCCSNKTRAAPRKDILQRRSIHKTTTTTRKKKKKQKQNKACKRPLSAYNFFFREERLKMIRANPNKHYGFDQFGEIIGRAWKALRAIDRQRYERMASQDSARYLREMDRVQQSKIFNNNNDNDNNNTSARTTTGSNEDDASPPHHPPSEDDDDSTNTAILHHWSGPPPTGGEGIIPARWPPISSAWLADAASLPAPPPSSAIIHLRPGMEVTMADPNGVNSTYKVQYSVYSMSEDDAEKFIQSMMAPPPPPLHHHHHHQPTPQELHAMPAFPNLGAPYPPPSVHHCPYQHYPLRNEHPLWHGLPRAACETVTE